MQLLDKKRGATNTPIRSLAEKNKTDCDYNLAMQSLQELRDKAWQHAIRYRFDPVLGKVHDEYLNTLNIILREF